jgi:CTP-dependent riboflavin kinase
MALQFTGRVQGGAGNAAHWLGLFNAAYARKLGAPVFPGSLNLALDAPFEWFAPDIVARTITFDRAEYGGARDILLVPCVLASLAEQPAWLWTTTTAARDRDDPWVVELIAPVPLRATYGLVDGAMVDVRIVTS